MKPTLTMKSAGVYTYGAYTLREVEKYGDTVCFVSRGKSKSVYCSVSDAIAHSCEWYEGPLTVQFDAGSDDRMAEYLVVDDFGNIHAKFFEEQPAIDYISEIEENDVN